MCTLCLYNPIQVEILKKDPNHQLLEELMTATFSQRRKEIVGDQPLIRDVMTRWPTMFDERQVTGTVIDDMHTLKWNSPLEHPAQTLPFCHLNSLIV